MSFRNAVYIVCSPRPRVGRTLLSRLLLDFHLANGRAVEAFDLNDDQELTRFFPAHVSSATVSGIRGQMALFDRLIAADGASRVIDVGNPALPEFLNVMENTGFAAEARARDLVPVLLFMVTAGQALADAYEKLCRRFPDAVAVPVYNEGEGRIELRDKFTPGSRSALPIHLPMLPPGLRNYIAKPPFSFYGPQTLKLPFGAELELQKWVRRVFLEFREMELRILLSDLQNALKDPA